MTSWRPRDPALLACLPLLALLGAGGAGCEKLDKAFYCRDDRQCVFEGRQGTCQPDRQCSFPDDACPGGQRYGHHVAGPLRDRCVPPRHCGDGQLESIETCDDGNLINDDGCTKACVRCDESIGDVRFADQDGHCLARFNPPLPWHKAQQTCESLGGHLATFFSEGAQAAAEEALLGGDRARFWIGHHVNLRDNVIEWITGEPLAFQPFHPQGNVKPGLGRDCTSMSPGHSPVHEGVRYLWGLEDCSNERPYLCEIPAWRPRPGSQSAYRVFTNRAPWQKAADVCASTGAHLVVFETEAERRFIARHYYGPFWIGATDREKEDVFVWVNGAPFGYEDFAPNEPDNHRGSQHCLMFDRDGHWHDRSCGDEHRFLCEYEPSP